MRRNRVWVTCKCCGKVLEVIKSREEAFRFCSKHCHAKATLSSLDKTLIPRRRGADNHKWKGGRRKHTQGYVTILVDGVYLMEHRHVMQQHLGRTLAREEHVHHLNGDKLDNRLENLQVLNIRDHGKEHALKTWSRKFPHCQGCGQDKGKHWALGFCRTCYKTWSYHMKKS